MMPPVPANAILDAGSIIALLADEPGAEVVEAWITDPTCDCCIHALNMGEVFYHFMRVADEDTAQEAVRELAAQGLTVREDMDAAFWQSAARLKADLVRVSLADCCGLALAMRVGGTFLTTDHHEFDPILARGAAPCPITFIR